MNNFSEHQQGSLFAELAPEEAEAVNGGFSFNPIDWVEEGVHTVSKVGHDLLKGVTGASGKLPKLITDALRNIKFCSVSGFIPCKFPKR